MQIWGDHPVPVKTLNVWLKTFQLLILSYLQRLGNSATNGKKYYWLNGIFQSQNKCYNESPETTMRRSYNGIKHSDWLRVTGCTVSSRNVP